MLNYIWLTLIVIGIVFAIVMDVSDISIDKFKNGYQFPVSCEFNFAEQELNRDKLYECKIKISTEVLNAVYATNYYEDLLQEATINFKDAETAIITIKLDNNSPPVWFEQSKAQQKDGKFLQGKIIFLKTNNSIVDAKLILDPVKFSRLNSVTNEGIVKYARTAVEISIGLIGIMALWLGLMKIAEASGLIQKIAKLLKPVTVRLFPDVPAEHPAMGAMIMNISANILGLANAATPLGLKAMQELNKLNKKLGTATDAMCTFLVINTSNVQLIPATVIAIRAASGSVNPTEILGPVIVATTISTIVGVISVKLLSKLKIFRKQLEESN